MDRPRERSSPSGRRFPRRRGDGPSSSDVWAARGPFPPQARGWTRRGCRRGRAGAVSPAGAGMDPAPPCPRSIPPGFPRRRGDGPPLIAVPRPLEPFPPQARGWTQLLQLDRMDAPVSPAGAGMDLAITDDPAPSRRFPRRRGDGPPPAPSPATRRAFPPQARGWTSRRRPPALPRRVSPAGAGMDPWPATTPTGSPRFPRRRGDGPPPGPPGPPPDRFPPQARGWTPGETGEPVRVRVSPAGAGMDPGRVDGRPRASGFPRRRGDGPSSVSHFSSPWEFPPQARGWTRRPRPVVVDGEVSPAGAGMDPWCSSAMLRRRGFPRRRGDGP